MTRLAATIVLTLAAGLSGCVALQRPDPTRPVEVVAVGLSTTYLQDGKPVHPGQLADLLRSHPATARQMEGYSAKAGAEAVFGSVGSAMVAWNVAWNLGMRPERRMGWGLAAVGAPLLVTYFPIALSAQRQMRASVETFNASLAAPPAPRQSSRWRLEPAVDQVCDARGARQAVMGFAVTF